MSESVQCILCTYYLHDKKCLAYPEGIPDKFFSGKESHDKIVKGQEGNFTHKTGNYSAIDKLIVKG